MIANDELSLGENRKDTSIPFETKIKIAVLHLSCIFIWQGNGE